MALYNKKERKEVSLSYSKIISVLCSNFCPRQPPPQPPRNHLFPCLSLFHLYTPPSVHLTVSLSACMLSVCSPPSLAAGMKWSVALTERESKRGQNRNITPNAQVIIYSCIHTDLAVQHLNVNSSVFSAEGVQTHEAVQSVIIQNAT